MRDDEKMFNLGIIMAIGMVCLIVFLQVCYREQNKNLHRVRDEMNSVQQSYAIAQTKFSTLSSADSLRSSVVEIDPRAEIVSFSKTEYINNIPLVQ
ncbi:MAG: hypothetical protein J6S57_00060 [Alphaproteobacteria bacterium]|nr:hypothetical protein [Alphaproteobacteria bacterium]